MAQIKSAADQLHDALRLAMLDAPIFIRKPVVPIVLGIDAWVLSVESRLELIEGQVRALNKMPSAEALAGLCAPSPAAVMPPAERQCICGAGPVPGCPVHRSSGCEDCVDG